MSCLGLEENVEGDPCKFVLTSRSPNGTVDSFVLHSSHPGVREVWTLQISQILESQRNFLNGRLLSTHTCTRTVKGGVTAVLYMAYLHLLHLITALTSPIEYQRNHVGAGSGPCAPSIGAPGGGGSGSSAAPGGGGVSSQSSSVPSGPQGGSRRPSRIPQPSRLPQPLRHHPGADPDGSGKMSGMKHLSVLVRFILFDQMKDVTEV